QVASETPIMSGFTLGTINEVSLEPPNARFHVGNILRTTLTATDYWQGTALELLREIAEATASSAWVDRNNVFHWAHPDAFDGMESSLEITSDADLLDLTWTSSISVRARHVIVSHRLPAVTVRQTANVDLWQGSGEREEREEEHLRFEFTQIASAG